MLMTPEEFDAVTRFVEDYRFELVHGVVIATRLPTDYANSDMNGELGHVLRSHQYSHPEGGRMDCTLYSEYLRFSDNRRCADRAVWIGLGRVPDPEKDVPTIVAEFVSKSARDRARDYEEKRRDYLNLGISEYWVIDRFHRTMTVFRRPPAQPPEQVFDAAATYRTPLLPGFELPLSKLFTRADYWKRPRKTGTSP
jgi:Uma2 family endonuclease